MFLSFNSKMDDNIRLHLGNEQKYEGQSVMGEVKSFRYMYHTFIIQNKMLSLCSILCFFLSLIYNS